MPIPSSVLYYPTIDIDHPRWLQTAALFWEEVSTIVPASLRSPYSSDFARALEDEGILVPVRVDSKMEEIEELSDLVLDYLTDPTSAGVIFGHNGNLEEQQARSEVLRGVRMYPEKLPWIVRNQIGELVSGRNPIEVDAGFADFYMTLLATRLCERLGLGLVTESGAAEQVATALRKGRPLGHVDSRRIGRHFRASGPRRALPTSVAPGMLMELMVEGITLRETIEARELISFRRGHTDELARLRHEVGRLVSDIPANTPIEAMRQMLKDRYRGQVRPAVNAVRRAMRGQGWETAVGGLLKTSLVTVPSGAVAMLAGIAAPHVLLAAAGVSLVATGITLFNQRETALRASPYSYLIALENQWA